MATVGEKYVTFKNGLSGLYDMSEAEAIAGMVFEHVLSFKRVGIALNRELVLDAKKEDAINEIHSELLTGKPIQYILGYTWFYGMKITVNEHVLIPRPETEELVDWVIKDAKGGADQIFLDVCTGSGCIALALKKEFPESLVTAIDFSQDALTVASQNARSAQLAIDFVKMDALDIKLKLFPSCIVSNPPYVLHSEINKMNRRVTEFEPHAALFVPDNDPLLFYRNIAEWAFKHLADNGMLFFEINESQSEEINKLLIHIGFSRVDFRKDMQGKIRMFRAVKS